MTPHRRPLSAQKGRTVGRATGDAWCAVGQPGRGLGALVVSSAHTASTTNAQSWVALAQKCAWSDITGCYRVRASAFSRPRDVPASQPLQSGRSGAAGGSPRLQLSADGLHHGAPVAMVPEGLNGRE